MVEGVEHFISKPHAEARKTFGLKVVFGAIPPLKITNLPEDCTGLRLRLRNDSFAKAFVRRPNGIESWAIEDKGDHWELGWQLTQGRNVTIKESKFEVSSGLPSDEKLDGIIFKPKEV